MLGDGLLEPGLGEDELVEGGLFEGTVVGEVEVVLLDLLGLGQRVPTHGHEQEDVDQLDVGPVLVVQQLDEALNLLVRDTPPSTRQQFPELEVTLGREGITIIFFSRTISFFVDILLPSDSCRTSLMSSWRLERLNWLSETVSRAGMTTG